MTAKPNASSDRGIALIVVLLLMMVLTGLATGFAMTGQIEGQMAQNEMFFAGARAAAEAGMNKAIIKIVDPANNTVNLLAGPDQLIDTANETAASNADNGSLSMLMGGAGPFTVDTAGQYSYTVKVYDDDDPALYTTPLTTTQLDAAHMNEANNNKYNNNNDRLILEATGYGPKGTVIKLQRILETVDTVNVTTTTTTTLANPAIVVNGNLELNGAITVNGTSAATASSGSVHANGNLSKTGASGTVTGSATASGSYSATGGFTPGGAAGGGRPTITVPDIQPSNYSYLANYKLVQTAGVVSIHTQNASGVWSNCTTAACNTAKGHWSYSGGYFNSDNNPTNATYYVQGSADIGTTSGSSFRSVSVIATGDIRVHGNAKLQPQNSQQIQFVAGGDLTIDNGSDLDPPVNIDGQIFVRGQFDAGGNMDFQGRVMVQDVAGAGTLVANGATKLHGSVRFTYGGTLGAISSTTTTTTTGPTTYVNNIHGWVEQ